MAARFLKVVFHRVPGARFVLFTRDPEAWFRSMLSHSDGLAIGDNREHAKAWRREPEFFARHAPEALHVGRLEDANKWVAWGHFLDVDVPTSYEAHQNSSADVAVARAMLRGPG